MTSCDVLTDISVVQYMASDHTFPIIQNRHRSGGSSLAGVQRESRSPPPSIMASLLAISSCFSHPDSLDTPCRHRSATQTDILVGMHDDETLRKSYGIVPGATVCVSHHGNCVSADSETCQPYTSYFPRADIYELISPDLLHQLIKGVFKDHLVDWVGKYLEHSHGAAGGARVIDEIDRR